MGIKGLIANNQISIYVEIIIVTCYRYFFFDNIASTKEVEKELGKLNKCELIRIIIRKKFLNNVKISDKVVSYIETSENSEPPNTYGLHDHNLSVIAESVNVLIQKCYLKISNIKLEAFKRIISKLERTIHNQKFIIDLLISKQNEEEKNDLNPTVAHVATTSSKSVHTENELLVKEPTHNPLKYKMKENNEIRTNKKEKISL